MAGSLSSGAMSSAFSVRMSCRTASRLHVSLAKRPYSFAVERSLRRRAVVLDVRQGIHQVSDGSVQLVLSLRPLRPPSVSRSRAKPTLPRPRYQAGSLHR